MVDQHKIWEGKANDLDLLRENTQKYFEEAVDYLPISQPDGNGGQRPYDNQLKGLTAIFNFIEEHEKLKDLDFVAAAKKLLSRTNIVADRDVRDLPALLINRLGLIALDRPQKYFESHAHLVPLSLDCRLETPWYNLDEKFLKQRKEDPDYFAYRVVEDYKHGGWHLARGLWSPIESKFKSERKYDGKVISVNGHSYDSSKPIEILSGFNLPAQVATYLHDLFITPNASIGNTFHVDGLDFHEQIKGLAKELSDSLKQSQLTLFGRSLPKAAPRRGEK